jgi:hypothetical protein
VRRDSDASTRFILSNNHVLAMNGLVFRKPGGNRIVNRTGRVIAMVDDLPPICELRGDRLNPGDFAIARLLDSGVVNPGMLRSPKPLPLRAGLQKTIYKTGQSGITRGLGAEIVTGFSLFYPSMNARFRFAECLRITPRGFSAPADSGALAVTEDGDAIGLVFAAADDETLVCPLDEMFESLGLSFVLPQEID